MYYYLSLQYSAIQKTVLRHDRLWSIAGISNTLARLNEIDLPDIAVHHGGTAIVAGGGKFTARFRDEASAVAARSECVRLLSTTLPMLEFQVSDIVSADTFTEAIANNNIIKSVNEQKQSFRGYASCYLPHLAVCAECGEYPAETRFSISVKEGLKWKDRYICRTCKTANDGAKIDFSKLNSDTTTTLEQVYLEYLKAVPDACHCQALQNFDDMFPDDGDTGGKTSKKRMAVWFSDLNNMNQKVPVWLGQNENEILNTFKTVKEVNIAVVATALAATFPAPGDSFLPFRVVVAGGDDLCMVMPEQYLLNFATNLAQAVTDKINELDADLNNPLNTAWLQDRVRPDVNGVRPTVKPYSFGGSFVLASLHTPFRAIHALGEELMSQAKVKSDRHGNAINWRIMAEDGAVAETLLNFERPLFVDRPATVPAEWDKLTFAEYLELRKEFKAVSGSHRFAIVDRLIRFGNDPEKLTAELKKYDSNLRLKSFSGLLTEKKLQRDNVLAPERLATLLELMSINNTNDRDEERI